jgi:hypothetical protein
MQVKVAVSQLIMVVVFCLQSSKRRRKRKKRKLSQVLPLPLPPIYLDQKHSNTIFPQRVIAMNGKPVPQQPEQRPLESVKILAKQKQQGEEGFVLMDRNKMEPKYVQWATRHVLRITYTCTYIFICRYMGVLKIHV